VRDIEVAFWEMTRTASHDAAPRVSASRIAFAAPVAGTLDLQAPSSFHATRGRWPLRAYGQVRAHIAPGKLGAASPTAFHPRPPGADKIPAVLEPHGQQLRRH
jgi:hypothetical protein